MLRALYTSATGMKAQELLIDNTANNLANVNTTGFRRSHMDFADLVYNTIQTPGAQTSTDTVAPTGLQIGNGVRVVSTTKHFTQGNLEQTGNPLDIGIEGDGFFQVENAGGELRYTRAGAFRLDANGRLVTPDGHLLSPNISVPQGTQNISVGADGTISGVAPGQDAQTPIGQLQLFLFPNPAGLSSEGSNMFRATNASGQATAGTPGALGYGVTRGQFLENANVEVVTELISLIAAQRAYEINSRAIQAGDEMLSTATDIVR